jgi:hypothetical protein
LYTWGDPKKTKETFVAGKPMQVTENLGSVIRVLRDKLPMRAEVKIWMVAICIDQTDLDEKFL